MKNLEELVGSRVIKIFMNEEDLKFVTDRGNIVLGVDGDCCSQSVFYDFYGVKKLLAGNVIVSIKEIELHPSDLKETTYGEEDKKSYQECISVYGYEIVTLDPVLGEVTSVFSFRNYSNGYYGGALEDADNRTVLPEITEDVIETVPPPKEEIK